MKLSWIIILLASLMLSSCKLKPGKEAKGYVVLSPEVAEILCALGEEAKITGITKECNYPASLATKKVIGNFSSIDKEAIIALNPKLIFCSALEQDGIAAELKKLGYIVEVIYPKTISALLQEIIRIGGLVGRDKEAEVLCENYRSSLRQIKEQIKGLKAPKVYIEIYRDPLMSVSDDSFVGELIEVAGGDNIFPTLERDYARVNSEAVIAANPEIMICYSQDTLSNILSRKGWHNIPAIKNKRIYFETEINPDLIQRATPRSLEGIQQLQKLFATGKDTK